MPPLISKVHERVRSPEAQDAFKRWFDASPIYSGPIVANRLGWQVMRTVAKNSAAEVRGLRTLGAVPEKLTSALDRDGMVVIPDYLPTPSHDAVRTAFEQYGQSPHLRDIGEENGSHIRYRSGPVRSDRPDDDAATIISLLTRDPLMIGLAEHVIHRRVRPPVSLVYQHLELPPGVVDDHDREQLLHADKFYSCAKAIYCVEAVTETSSPFVYCPGSHRVTVERLRYERAMSIRDAELRAGHLPRPGGEIEFDQIDFDRSRNVIGTDFRERLDLHERPLTCAANTLILVNNRGFHRRGVLAPGQSRKTLWVNFYPYQRPFYGRLAFRAAKRVIDTDNVSRALPAVYTQSA